MDKKEIKEDMEEKEKILKWLVRNNVNTVNTVGQVISKYYTDKDSLFKNMRRGNLHEIFGKFISELKVK